MLVLLAFCRQTNRFYFRFLPELQFDLSAFTFGLFVLVDSTNFATVHFQNERAVANTRAIRKSAGSRVEDDDSLKGARSDPRRVKSIFVRYIA